MTNSKKSRLRWTTAVEEAEEEAKEQAAEVG
jgi:hypothetical protein